MNNYKITSFYLFSFIAVMLTLQNCQMDPCGSGPADLIGNMEGLVKDVKKSDYKPKDDRWQSYDDRFKTYFDDCYDQWSADMTFDQKREFTGLVTRYMANRFGRSFFRSIFGSDEVESADIPEFFEDLGEDLQHFLEDNKESGKEFLEDLKKKFSEQTDENTK